MLLFQFITPASRKTPAASPQEQLASLEDRVIERFMQDMKKSPGLVSEPVVWEYAARLNYFAMRSSASRGLDGLFSSDRTPADFKKQLAAHSLPAPSDEVMANIMNLKDANGLKLELNEKFYQVGRNDERLILFDYGSDEFTSNLSIPSPFTDGVNLILDIAKENAQVALCAAALNAAQYSQALIQVRKKITEIGNESHNPDLLKQATEYANSHPLRDIMPVYYTKSEK